MELLLLEIPPPNFCKILNDLERIPRKLRRTCRTRDEFHANLEIEEMLGHMFPSWPKSQVSPRTSRTREEFHANLDVRAELAKNSTQI